MIWEIVKEILKENTEGKSPKQIASYIGVSLSTIYRWAEDPESSGVLIPSDKIIQISLFTGDDRLIKFFADECGRTLIKIPEPRHARIKELTRELAVTIRKFSVFISAAAEALEDRKLTNIEKDMIKKLSANAIDEILLFREATKHVD
jgi:hypothetical protein